ncbi:MAG: rhomboid family intramembrane serine protease [Pseudomonadota bacterium]
MQDPQRPPSAVNPLPAAVVALATVIIGVELIISLMEQPIFGGLSAGDTRINLLERYAFFGQRLDLMLSNGQFPVQWLITFVTYPFIHASLWSAVFVCVFILAMGKIVGEAFGSVAVLSLFFASSIFGALIYGLLLNEDFPLIGAWPGVYGLIGGFTFVLWVRQQALGESSARAFQLIALLLGLQLFFGLLFGGHNDWVADLAGFACGFGLSFLMVPGGWARLREALRNRRR